MDTTLMQALRAAGAAAVAWLWLTPAGAQQAQHAMAAGDWATINRDLASTRARARSSGSRNSKQTRMRTR